MIQLLFLLICSVISPRAIESQAAIESQVGPHECDAESAVDYASADPGDSPLAIQVLYDAGVFDIQIGDLQDGHSAISTEWTEKTLARRQRRFVSDSTAAGEESFDDHPFQEMVHVKDCDMAQSETNPTNPIKLSDIKLHASHREYDAKIYIDKPIKDFLRKVSMLSETEVVGAFCVSKIQTNNGTKEITLKDTQVSEENHEITIEVPTPNIVVNDVYCARIKMQQVSRYVTLTLDVTCSSNAVCDDKPSDDEPFFPMSNPVDPDDFTHSMERKLNEIFTTLNRM